MLVNLSNHADERTPDVIFIENSCFDSNKSYAGRGGVIYNSDCIKINDSEFKNNKALNRGGVIQNQMSGKIPYLKITKPMLMTFTTAIMKKLFLIAVPLKTNQQVKISLKTTNTKILTAANSD